MRTWKIAGVVALAGRLHRLIFCAIGVSLMLSLAFAPPSSANEPSAQDLVSGYAIQNGTRAAPGHFIQPNINAGLPYMQAENAGWGFGVEYEHDWGVHGMLLDYDRTPTDSQLVLRGAHVDWSKANNWHGFQSSGPNEENSRWPLTRHEFNVLHSARVYRSPRLEIRILAGPSFIVLASEPGLSGLDRQIAATLGARISRNIGKRWTWKGEILGQGLKNSDFADNGSEKLPVRRVVLYKNGVGYFEHLGRVSGSQDVHIDFTSEQLNDVLKSLTVLDLSGGRITAVDYNSEAPLARRLATLRLALGERPSQSEFLAALRGARIEVRSGTAGPIIGKLLSVERKTRSSTTLTIETDEISLITDSGEVRSVDLNPSTSVRILEHDLQVEVNRYLGLVAAAREQDVRRMSISTTGSGERNLYVSYISEVPIWKTTYRIVLPTRPDKKPLLQGWAVVDNTVGEDWNDVELSLVAGAPHSFIQQLSEPYYGRRPVVALPQNVQLAPQTHAATLLGGNGRLAGQVTDPSGAVVSGTSVMLLDESGNPVANTFTDSAGNYSFSGLPIGNYRLELDKTGFRRILVSQLNVSPGENQMNANLQIGSTAETVEVTSSAAGSASTQSSEMASNAIALPGVANRPRIASGSGAGVGPGEGGGVGGGSFRAGASGVPANSYLEAARELSGSAANGQDLGDLFDYKLKDRVTLKKNQSALVPIVQTDIVAEKVSLWNGTARSGRPLRALWLTNTSPLTLDGGSFSVLENEVFAGEGLTDPIKPGERRLLSYATDLALLVEARKSGDPQHVTRVKIAKGVMTQTSEIRERTVYTVRNQDDSACVLVIEQPARPDASLAKRSKEPEERAPGVYRFKIEVPAKASASLPVEEVRVLQSNFRLADLDDSQIAVFSKNGTITPDMAQALQKIAAQKAVLSKLEQDMEDRQKDIDRIVADQARLRENMKALRGSAEEKALLQRYTGELDQQETQLTSLRKTIQDTEAQRDKANDQLQDMIENVQLESTM